MNTDAICVELQEFMGSDRSVAEAAWTSSSTLQSKTARTDEDVARLVQMLAKNKHSTPFETVVLRFWIKMPIQTDRQHVTHRIATHNGMSGRYRTMPREWLDVPEDIKQILMLADQDFTTYQETYNNLCHQTNEWYNKVLRIFKELRDTEKMTKDQYKRLREFFRGVLPQNNLTERVTVMNLRSFANYQKLRNSEHAQPEIRQVAELMLKAVKNKGVAPIAVLELEKNGWTI